VTNKMSITVRQFINRLQELGYTDNTTLHFGFNGIDGEWIEFEIEEMEDDDRTCGVDAIGVEFKENEEYKKSVLVESNMDLENDLKDLIERYCR